METPYTVTTGSGMLTRLRLHMCSFPLGCSRWPQPGSTSMSGRSTSKFWSDHGLLQLRIPDVELCTSPTLAG
eukprot:9472322-Pyramimonas_sp.AAC.1